MCRKAINIVSKANKNEEVSMFLAKKMVALNLDVEMILKKILDLRSNNIGMDSSHNEHVDVVSSINANKAKAINKKMGTSLVKGVGYYGYLNFNAHISELMKSIFIP